MKWMKKYEELSPKTYIGAGRKLYKIGQYSRGNNLADYGVGYKHDDVYDMIVNGEYHSCRFQFLKSETTFNIYSYDDDDWHVVKTVDELGNFSEDDQDTVEIIVDFFFEKLENVDKLKVFNLFSIKYKIWDNGSYYPQCYMCLPSSWLQNNQNTHDCGILLDRKNSVKFTKNILLKIIEDHDKFPLSDVVSICGGNSDTLDKCFKDFKKVNINHIYADNCVARLKNGEDYNILNLKE